METEQLAQADGHIGVAGEVIVDLQGIAQGPQPGKGGREVPDRRVPGGVGHHGQLVGEEHLFPQAHNEAAAAGGEVRPGLPAALDLVGYGGVLDDGPGDELGKEGDVETQPEGVALDLRRPHGHVKDIAQGLEGEEGDADGQADHRNRGVEPR